MTFCRDCFAWDTKNANSSCNFCGSPKVVNHKEILKLAIAHIDCDAFYASIEKRDDKSLIGQPVIIGGGSRGVVATACYIARIYGIHSAMPMFKALRLCPTATVIRPNMNKYIKISKEIRKLMLETTPMVEPISIDEAFLDLSGTERLHRSTPTETLARLASKIYDELGITVSIGLSYNKFLAKVASDLNKPKGFSLIGEKEARQFLSERPIGIIMGVGKRLQAKLKKDGIVKIKDLQKKDASVLVDKYGKIGQQLATFSQGIDLRKVNPVSSVKSISTETTFGTDVTGLDNLRPIFWNLCEALSKRIKQQCKSGKVVTVKFKTFDFQTFTRRRTLKNPTQLAEVLYQATREILARESGKSYRLLGIGVSDLYEADYADRSDLLDLNLSKSQSIEKTIDSIREKLGDDSIKKGRSLNRDKKNLLRTT